MSRYTDLPYLIALEPVDGGGYRPGKFVTAADLGETDAEAAFRPVLWDTATDAAGGARTARSGTGSARPASASGTSTSARSCPG